MDDRPSTDLHSLLHTEFHWTPRQREVLDLIARDKTNQEIADTLGVSLDGAKWHMREILSKLNVERREDAAEYWRLHNGWRPRLGRAWRSLAGVSALKLTGAAVAGATVLFAGVAVVLSLRGDEPPAGAPPAEASPSATTTPAASSPSPTLPPPPPTPRQIVLDTSERPQPAETTRVLGPPPDSVFPPWDGVSTVIYDIERRVAIDLGPGVQPAAFNKEETYAVWVSGTVGVQGNEAWLLDLQSGARKSLGPARIAGFTDDGKVVTYAPSGNDRFVVDPVTGQRMPATDETSNFFTTNPAPYPPPGYTIDPPGPHSPDVRTFAVKDATTGATYITFEAVTAAMAGPNHVAAISPPVNGTADVYLIEIATGATTFVARAIPGKDNIPFSADENSILWTDGFCGTPQGMVTMFDRRTGALTRFDFSSLGPNVSARYALLVPGGRIAIGSFGAAYLVERDTLAVAARIPGRPNGYGGDISWSSNYRYASRGIYGGHGGLCGGA